ncbi:extensin family protein [soil metagenome]
MKKTVVLMLLAVGAMVLAYALQSGAVRFPDAWNPWAPIAVADPPNWLTGYKLGRLSDDAALCRIVLQEAEMVYDTVPDRVTGEGCGFFNAVRIEATTVAVGEPFTLSCRAAAALAIWELHVLQPAARERFGSPVAEIEHFGSYACRGVYGREDGRRSGHATADALDLAGFVLEDGRRIRVLGDWPGDDDEAAFLRDLHRGACRVFDGVLGPEYNAAHHDHFHFEQGGLRLCR